MTISAHILPPRQPGTAPWIHTFTSYLLTPLNPFRPHRDDTLKMKFFPFIICLLLILLLSGANAAEVATRKTLAAALQSALAKEDLTAVREAVAAERRALGEKAGVPEVADKHVAIPKSGRWLTPAEPRPGRVAPGARSARSSCDSQEAGQGNLRSPAILHSFCHYWGGLPVQLPLPKGHVPTLTEGNR